FMMPGSVSWIRSKNLPKLAGPFLQTVSLERKSPAAMIQQLELDQAGMAKDLTKNRRVVMPSWTEHEEIKELQQFYSRNKVRTTKYTFISFIPKNLFEQLHRFANVYFVFLGALNFVPIVNAFQPEISIIPIVFVMSITAVKDLWEDQRRKKSDQQVNNFIWICMVKCQSYTVSLNL
uniref:P-type ATPase N-terminal domain-containing protein n=1 Tax=Sinocyclocheilus grahami TaxID=75366 RepID=A0A672MPY8_SINGR